MQMTATQYDSDQRLAEIGYDLRQAIEQLRAVPGIRTVNDSAGYRHHVSAKQFPVAQGGYGGNNTRNDDVTEYDKKSHGDRQSMFWNIRRMRKHRLHPTGYKSTRPIPRDLPPDQQASWQNERQLQSGSVSSDASTDCCGSNESLDSVIERILESSAPDNMSDETPEAKLSAASTRQLYRHPDLLRHGGHGETKVDTENQVTDSVLVTLDVNKRHFVLRCNDNGQQQTENVTSHVVYKPNDVSQRQMFPTSTTKRLTTQEPDSMTFEELFEEAVESVENTASAIPIEMIGVSPHEKHYRGEENWEQRLYDHDVHQHCHQYKLQAVSVVHDAQYSRVSRGFALVEKINKVPSSKHQQLVEPEQDGGDQSSRADTEVTGGRKTYKQRTVINASLQTPYNGEFNCQQPISGVTDDCTERLDLGLDAEISANMPVAVSGVISGLSRSSSITWDTISVDSLVMMDDDNSTLRAMYSASTSTAPRLQPRQLADNISTPTMTTTASSDGNPKTQHFQTCSTSLVGKTEVRDEQNGHSSNETTESTIENKTTHRQQNAVNANSSDDSDHVTSKSTATPCPTDVTVLSDSVTTQTLVLNVKLPRNLRKLVKDMPKLPPFRELRLHREMILSDANTNFNGSGHNKMASLQEVAADANIEVERVNGQQTSDVTLSHNDVIVLQTLRPNELMESLPVETEVEFDNRSATSSLEPVVSDENGKAELIGVERTEAVRVMRVRGKQPCHFRFEAASLKQLVDETRQAFTTGGACRSESRALGVTCQAIETRSANSDCPPVVVSDITVDCLLDDA